MIEDFKKFKEVFKKASELGKDIKPIKYDKIVFCGIGGSALPGDVIQSLDLKVPVFVAREGIPNSADNKTLCFIVSYSGDTQETLNLYEKAKSKKCRIIIITSGGKMKKFREKKVMVPAGYLPREAFLWLLLPVLNILKINYSKSININLNVPKRLAEKFKNKIPLIYASSEHFGFLSYRWETFFEENCKMVANSGFFPEVKHNEIESRFDPKEFQGILIYDKSDKVIREFRKIIKINFAEVKLKGKSFVDKTIYGLYFGFMLSYFVADILGMDYRKMERIKLLKRKLK